MALLTDIRRSTRRRAAPRVSLFGLAALARQRRELARLDARALSDIGLSRDEALAEARRPIWDVPGHWLR